MVPILLFVSLSRQRRGRLGARRPAAGAAPTPRSPSALIVILGRLLLRPMIALGRQPPTRASCSWPPTLFVIVGSGLAAGARRPLDGARRLHRRPVARRDRVPQGVETTIEPFKGLLLGLFFFTVGMNIDFRELAREPLWLLASVVGLIGIKAALIVRLARLFRVPWRSGGRDRPAAGPGRRVRLRHHRRGDGLRPRQRARPAASPWP